MKVKLFDLHTSPEGMNSQFVQIIRNYHWMVTDSGKLIHCGSIQCNQNKEICESMIGYWLKNFNLVVHVEFHPVVLVPVDVRNDWRYEV